MQFAVSATSPGWGPTALAGLSTFAEGLGYRDAWLAEVAGPEAFTTAAAIAVATDAMDLGIAVAGAYTRTPAVLAMAAASVGDLLAGRSMALAIGSSSETIVTRWNGVPFERPLRRVRETVEAVRAGLDGTGSFSGETVSMDRFRLATVSPGPVEVWVGALNPGHARRGGSRRRRCLPQHDGSRRRGPPGRACPGSVPTHTSTGPGDTVAERNRSIDTVSPEKLPVPSRPALTASTVSRTRRKGRSNGTPFHRVTMVSEEEPMASASLRPARRSPTEAAAMARTASVWCRRLRRRCRDPWRRWPWRWRQPW